MQNISKAGIHFDNGLLKIQLQNILGKYYLYLGKYYLYLAPTKKKITANL